MRGEVITLRLSSEEVARLDELRGSNMSRSGFVRQLLRQSGPLEDHPSRLEALRLLAESARARKVSAQIALARELREGGERDLWQWVLEGDRGE